MAHSSSNEKATVQIDHDLLLTRKELAALCHCGLSSIDALEVYASLPRVKLGRHTFFLKSDVMEFILSYRVGGTYE